MKRAVRKLTRWSEEEWAQVAAGARAAGVPPLRYVREAALGKAPAPRRSRGTDEMVRQLARALNNLRQLQRIAELDGEDGAAERIGTTVEVVEAAIRATPSAGADGMLLAALVAAGVVLNELAHRANTDEELPPDAELLEALAGLETVVRGGTAG